MKLYTLDNKSISESELNIKLAEGLEKGVKIRETSPGSGKFKTLTKLRD